MTTTKSAIYTKKGDSGTAAVLWGERISKGDSTFEALGTVDELNANIGLARDQISAHTNTAVSLQLGAILVEVQRWLYRVGTALASDKSTLGEGENDDTAASSLERRIDYLDAQMPPLREFVVPGGAGLASSQLHVARTVCRRAERECVRFLMRAEGGRTNPNSTWVLRFLNRLSDLLFVCARWCALNSGGSDVVAKLPK